MAFLAQGLKPDPVKVATGAPTTTPTNTNTCMPIIVVDDERPESLTGPDNESTWVEFCVRWLREDDENHKIRGKKPRLSSLGSSHVSEGVAKVSTAPEPGPEAEAKASTKASAKASNASDGMPGIASDYEAKASAKASKASDAMASAKASAKASEAKASATALATAFAKASQACHVHD